MDNKQLIVTCESSNGIIKATGALLPLLSKEDRRLFNDIKHFIWSVYGIEVLFEKFNGRTVESIINENANLVPQRVAAKGRIGNMNFTLLQGPDESNSNRPATVIEDQAPQNREINFAPAFPILEGMTKNLDYTANTVHSFFDRYAAILANLGIEHRFDDHIYKKIQRVQQLNGIFLPQSLVEFLSLSAGSLKTGFNRFRTIDQLTVNQGKVIFLEENQLKFVWGVECTRNPVLDLEVYCGIPKENGFVWRHEHESCERFLCLMTIWIGTFGGQFPINACGYVDETAAKQTFAAGWDFVAEVNGIRAFQKEGLAACYFHCEDLMQRLEGLATGRVHLAGKSAEFIDQAMRTIRGRWRIMSERGEWEWWN